MKDNEIDKILAEAARSHHDVDPALLDRVSQSIKPAMYPVRPLPSATLLKAALVLVCSAVAIAGAARAGFYGVADMSVLQRALIFPVLGIFIWLAASISVSEMIPGSRHSIAPGTLLGICTVALLAVFGFLFREYQTDHFLSAGIICLITGLLHAFPTAIVSWLILRRGFAVDAVAAGLAAGTLAGLAGVSMLELHCPNFQAWHILVWHTAVLPVSAAAGALVGSRVKDLDTGRAPAKQIAK